MKSLTWKAGKVFAYVAAMAAVTSVASASSLSEMFRVYDNTGQQNGSYYSPGGTATTTYEFGDEVNLTFQSGRTTLENVTFGYFLSTGGRATAVFRLYDQTGPEVGTGSGAYAPGNLLVQQIIPWPQLTPGFANTVSLDFNTANDTVTLPDKVTWTVNFQDLTTGTQVGLLTANGGAAIGSSYNDYWERNASGDWEVKTLDGQYANFSAKISAVPEVGTISMALFGGLVWLGFFGYRRASRKA